MPDINDYFERIVRLETELNNLKESHNVTKSDFANLRKWVEGKFDELFTQLTELRLASEKTATKVALLVSGAAFIGTALINWFMR